MVPGNLISEVAEFVRDNDGSGSVRKTGINGVFAFCSETPTQFEATFYVPFMGLVLQGTKEAQMEDRVIRYGAGMSLILSHALPVNVRVIDASPEKPYVALAVLLDLATERGLYDEVGSIDDQEQAIGPLSVAEGDAALTDAMARLFRLSSDPVEVQALAPLVLKEIHFRFMRAKHGAMVRQLLLRESPASRISKAISRIRTGYKAPIAVAELAAAVGMSQSTFYEHFKMLTSTTPLQYQKELRLLEARRILQCGGKSVASTAYDVGYESPTQFSREYVRKFGVSPRDEKAGSAVSLFIAE